MIMVITEGVNSTRKQDSKDEMVFWTLYIVNISNLFCFLKRSRGLAGRDNKIIELTMVDLDQPLEMLIE